MEVTYINHMGDDLMVVNSARVSFNKESNWEIIPHRDGWCQTDIAYESYLSKDDKKLIGYLASHGHWTPFSHPQVTLREKVPIFVARQRFKHMVGFSYNEVSRRYVDDTPEFFTPDKWRGKPTGGAKQGSSGELPDGVDLIEASDLFPENVSVKYDDGEVEHDFFMGINSFHELCEIYYNRLLYNEVAPEQARMILPQSMYTEYYVTGSLAAWARAYKQRIDAHAQKEIQDVAVEWGNILEPLFPVSWKALTK